MRQKFGLVGSDIDVDRTIAFAAFARKAEIKGLFDIFIAPGFLDDVAVQHLPEQMSAASRCVFFLVRDHIAGAHRVLLALAIRPPALSHPDATQCSVREAAVVVRKLEVSLWLPRLVGRAEPKVLINAIWLDDLPGIHFPIRVPNGFEFPKSLNQFASKHFVEKLSFGLAVTMLA